MRLMEGGCEGDGLRLTPNTQPGNFSSLLPTSITSILKLCGAIIM